MDTKKYQQLMNPNGILVNKCCKSCKHLIIDDDCLRHCLKRSGRLVRSGTGCCQMWKMSKGLCNAGLSGGVVKDIVTKEIIIR